MRKPISFDDDAEVAEAQAQQAIDQMVSLSKSEGWRRLDAYIQDEIAGRLRSLETTEQDGDRHRGALEALRFIQGYPQRIIKLGSAELSKHRGS